jgi:D-tyrosyl-tRNA(Tyr) deacylase
VKIVLQRVSQASVSVGGECVGAVGTGLLLLLGVGPEDTEAEGAWLASKVAQLRIFPDESGRMNRSLLDVGGGVLVVSQFTLYGDCTKGRRPSFVSAAPPELAQPLYLRFIEQLRSCGVVDVASGVFGASMDVALHNDGPVTLVIESPASRTA